MFKVGQKVRVVGDTFKQDPHGLEVGAVYEVHSISPATPFNEFPPLLQLIFAIEGIEPHDLPERVHVKTGDGDMDFANLVFADVQLCECEAPKLVRMLEDCFLDGYEEGDVFEVHYDEDGDSYFIDNDGDERSLDAHEHEIIE
jgi:hypothetical protein